MIIADKKKCNGCELCANVCPNKSISMIPDEEGFLYPFIDSESCNGCKLCETKCPINNIEKIRIDSHNIEALSGFYKDGDKLKKSASGGLSSALAERVISSGGKVYGVTYCANYKSAEYIGITNADEIELLKDSKYIQAKKGDIYKQVKSDAEQNKQVLFVGLPCETAAVKSFLGKEYDNLITCELICHGPTSAKVAEQYIDRIEKLHKSKVKFFSVRHKELGWTPPFLKAVFENGDVYAKPFYGTEYGVAFENMTRLSCYNCSFKGDNRVSDLTIGDFWGITPSDKGYNKDGVSIALVNTEKGKSFIKTVSDGFLLEKADIDFALLGNPRVNSSKPNINRENFSRFFVRSGLFYACSKGTAFKAKLLRFILSRIPIKILAIIIRSK